MPTTAETITIHFGKHDGTSVQEIARTDPEYARWAAENLDREHLASAFEEALQNAGHAVETPSKEKVRRRIDFLDLVSGYTRIRRREKRKIRRKGKGVVRCPFHNDESPSCSIDLEEKVYNCFSCGAQGDLFHFVMEADGVDFREAVNRLAERVGLV